MCIHFTKSKENNMKRHRQFELFAGEFLSKKGFANVDVTRGVADWGADVFCEKNGNRYVGQVKMYGTSKTKISRKDVMELYGVMAYFDCQGAFFIYNGRRNEEAIQAASKLGIEWIEVNLLEMDEPLEETLESPWLDIDYVWNNHIKLLEGKELTDTQGNVSKVISVDDAVIWKESSNGKRSNVKKDLFKWILDRIAHYGYAEAIDIRNEFHSQASSFITLVFKALPGYQVTYNPRRIELSNSNQ